MGVIIEKDCIKRPDGTLICYDKEEQKTYKLTKKEVDIRTELSEEEFREFLVKMANPTRIMYE